MKIFKFMTLALVAMLGFSSCSEDCDHNFIEHDHSADLVGTWTCFKEGFAEALVISADGSVVSTGVADGKYWENVKGKISVKDGKATLAFEDDIKFEGHFDIIPGMVFSILEDNGNRFTLNYCKEDLAEEVVGMWVCNDGRVDVENDMMIQSFNADGSLTYTGYAPLAGGFTLNGEGTYKVIGDLAILKLSEENLVEDASEYMVKKLNYSPMGTAMGDIITFKGYYNGEEMTTSWLRVKQSLDLAGKKYDYIKTFVTNVDGLDQDIDFMGYTFNFAKMDGTTIDQMLKALLFSVEFPSANKIKYSCRFSSGVQTVEAPIAVDGNKMTLKMSDVYPTAKDVDLYTFQDADCSQMHMYMPTYAFINFFGNMQVIMMSQLGQLDTNNADAVKAVFDSIDNAVNTINVSFVMEKARK